MHPVTLYESSTYGGRPDGMVLPLRRVRSSIAHLPQISSFPLDIRREPPKKRRRYVYIAAGLVGIAGTTLALSRLEPAAPSVERGTLWIDSVRKGTMLRQVRAPGTLVPEQIRLISAVTAGRVEQILVRPGTPVTAQTALLEMSNPDVQLQALEAQRQLTAAEGDLVNLRSSLETARLQQEGAVATLRTQHQEAQRTLKVVTALEGKKLASENEIKTVRERAAELEQRLEIEQQRLQVLTESQKGQLALQKAQVERNRAIAQFQEDRVQSMKVVAGSDGVLQELGGAQTGQLELGTWVNPGFILAKVAQPGKLKAVLRVPETQAKDVVLGQPTSIDTRNGVVAGHVMRIDPAVQNGTVAVEVALEGQLPRGARPDLSVDGTIEIERLQNVLYVGRPAYGQAESVVGLFRLEPDGKTASRVNVKLGRSSVNTIEVVQGLQPGDRVIISDMTQWDNADKVRLKYGRD
jgi:HlyD family secretion protein